MQQSVCIIICNVYSILHNYDIHTQHMHTYSKGPVVKTYSHSTQGVTVDSTQHITIAVRG